MTSVTQKLLYFNLKKSIQQRSCGSRVGDAMIFNTKIHVNCDGEPTKWPSGHKIHYKFHPETEVALNQQINAEFEAFYHYLSMAAYFGRVDVALPGCEAFFIQMHNEEHGHALQFLDYIKMRGGSIKLSTIPSPLNQDWQCPLIAFKKALEMEMKLTDKLIAANAIAEKHSDVNTSDFIVTEFMGNQMKSINQFSKFITVLSGMGDKGLSRFIFDRDLLNNVNVHHTNLNK